MKRSNPHYKVKRVRLTLVPDSGTSVLTATSKMPGPSFSLPAKRACPNAKGTICHGTISATGKRIGGCYAAKGCYRYRSVSKAQDTRFDWIRDCLKTAAGTEHFIHVMVRAIRAVDAPYFRGHDSGDFFSVAYVEAWIQICSQLPNVRFWFPTREWQVKSASPFQMLNPRMDALKRLAALPNVTVRPSALDVGDDAPIVPGLAAGSTVAGSGYQCPAYLQGGECGDCRTCWDSPETAVSYPLH